MRILGIDYGDARTGIAMYRHLLERLVEIKDRYNCNRKTNKHEWYVIRKN